MDSDAGSTCSRSSSPDLVVDDSAGSFFSNKMFQKYCLESRQSGEAGQCGLEHCGGGGKAKGRSELSKEEVQDLRLKVNSRERKRMHDLNQAMDGLREVMPYAHGPSVRKLSKISTLLLARNYILMLSSSLEEMKKLVGDVYSGSAAAQSRAAAHHAITPAATAAHLPLHPLAQSLHSLVGSAPLQHHSSSPSSAPHSPPTATFLGFHAPVQSLLKEPLHLSSSYRHFPGMPCPCTLCQPLPTTTSTLHSLSMNKWAKLSFNGLFLFGSERRTKHFAGERTDHTLPGTRLVHSVQINCCYLSPICFSCFCETVTVEVHLGFYWSSKVCNLSDAFVDASLWERMFDIVQDFYFPKLKYILKVTWVCFFHHFIISLDCCLSQMSVFLIKLKYLYFLFFVLSKTVSAKIIAVSMQVHWSATKRHLL